MGRQLSERIRSRSYSPTSCCMGTKCRARPPMTQCSSLVAECRARHPSLKLDGLVLIQCAETPSRAGEHNCAVLAQTSMAISPPHMVINGWTLKRTWFTIEWILVHVIAPLFLSRSLFHVTVIVRLLICGKYIVRSWRRNRQVYTPGTALM